MRIFFSIILILITCKILGEEVVEKYKSGKVKKIYNRDSSALLEGECKEYYENGNLKIVSCYLKNKLNGAYQEFDDTGNLKTESKYRNDKKHGWENIYEKKIIISSLFYIEGEVAFTRSILEIQSTLKKIKESPIEFVGEWPDCYIKLDSFSGEIKKQNEEALRIIKSYRYLCELPFEQLTIKHEYVAKCMAANDIGERLKGITHYPINPGMPEKDYQFAYKGTSNSNLFNCNFKVPISVPIHHFLSDSDKLNQAVLGHRRWCLSPLMGATGFASTGLFTSMFITDQSNLQVNLPEYICYPPKGLVPCEWFADCSIWSVILNSKSFRKPEKNSLKINIAELGNDYQILNINPVEIEILAIDQSFIGFDSICVIFKPKSKVIVAGKKYLIEMSGLFKKNSGKSKFSYYVEFY